MTNQNGKVVVIAAPSGAGKTSLVKALIESSPDIDVAVSHTTRSMRPHEVDGINYHFIGVEDFRTLQAEDGFVESAEVFGNLYGTSRDAMNRIIQQGKHLVLEIDWQGANQIREKVPSAISIFILPPSLATLKQRLQSRGQDDAAAIERRTQEAMNEISHFEEFDFLVVNDDFDVAVRQICSIIETGEPEFNLKHQLEAQRSLLSELLTSSL
ncbi:MAG: guanylate kinase [Candidatus Azotimanducaceae bacterium]|jgi:guanylate kinase